MKALTPQELRPMSLRIGNLCMDYYGYVFEVVELSQDTVGADDKLYKQNDVFGIPLTNEWLEKFGWQFSEVDGYWFRDSDNEKLDLIRIVQSSDGFFDYEYGIPLPYLHTLQNLAYLVTGEELTISSSN